MNKFLQMEGGKTFLHLLRKKQLATFAALLCLMAMMPLTAKAETINIVSSHEELTKTSTVYLNGVECLTVAALVVFRLRLLQHLLCTVVHRLLTGHKPYDQQPSTNTSYIPHFLTITW